MTVMKFLNCSVLKNFPHIAYVFCVGVALIGSSVWIGCSPSHSEPEINSSSSALIPATEVAIIEASAQSFEYLIQTSGRVTSAYEVTVPFGRAGIVNQIKVLNGSIVKKGDILVMLDNEVQKLALAKAKINLDEKQLSFNDQMLSYRNMKDSSGLAKISANIKLSSGLAAAEISYHEAKLEYERSFLRAPISGVVSGVEISEGSAVEKTAFCFIHDPHYFQIETQVIESDAIQLRPGILAVATPTSMPDRIYDGRVENVNPRVDTKTGMVKVVVALNGTPEILPGMNLQVTLKLPSRKNVVVPREAIVVRSGKHVVFTFKNRLAKWNYVTVGRENGKQIEVLDGLSHGDSVIVENNLQLAHDALVSLKPK